MRAVFDTSVLIRFALGSGSIAGLVARAAAGDFILLSNDLLIAELAATASKSRLAPRLDRAACNDLLAFLRNAAEAVAIAEPFPACRDPDDAYLLAMARDGAADYLVTNDQDLLSLVSIGRCAILTPEAFAAKLHPSDA